MQHPEGMEATRPRLVATAVGIVALAMTAGSVSAKFSDLAGTPLLAPQACFRAIVKAHTKYTKAAAKLYLKCKKAALAGDGAVGDCLDAGTGAKLVVQQEKLAAAIAKRCGGLDRTCGSGGDDVALGDVSWDIGSCRALRGSGCETITVDDCADIATCLHCLSDASVDRVTDALVADQFDPSRFGARTEPDRTLNRCQQTILREVGKHVLGTQQFLAKCWDRKLKRRFDTFNDDDLCPDTDAKTVDKVETVEAKKVRKICKACGGEGDADHDGRCDLAPGGVPPFLTAAFTCPDVTLPEGGVAHAYPSGCGSITISDLQSYLDCVDCVAAYEAGCVGAAGVGSDLTLGLVYPDECSGKVPGPRDIFFVNNNSFSSQRHELCRGDGEGAFTCSYSFTALDSRGAVTGDFDEDGHLDVVLANDNPNQLCRGNGNGGFSVSNIDTHALTTGVASGDFDENGHLDVVFSNYSYGFEDTACLGDGDGGFTCSDVSTAIDPSRGVASGDVNGDDHLDVVFANGSQRDRVCLGSGAGTFTCSDVSTDTYAGFGVTLVDLDDDGLDDAVFANGNQRNRVCLATGGGAFSCADVDTTTRDSRAVAAGDVNGDGDRDVVFGNYGQVDQVCLGDGTGALSCSDLSPSDARGTLGVALADLDGDGDLDAVLANDSSQNLYCENDGTGAFTCANVGTSTDFTNAVVAGRFFE